MSVLIINIPVKESVENIRLFNLLGFELVNKEYNVFSNGDTLLRFSDTATFEKGFFVYNDDIDATVSDMESKKVIFNCKSYDGDQLLEADLFDPNKVFVGYKNTNNLAIDKIEQNSDMGSFAGLGIETTDIAKTMDFWKKIGFNHIPENDRRDIYSEMVLDNNKLLIYKKGVVKHLFHSPALVFKSSNLDSIVENLKSKGIVFRYESEYDMTIQDAVIELDTGFHIFLKKM